MDPVPGAVVAIVLLFGSIPLVWVLSFVVSAAVAELVTVDSGFIGAFIGWVLGFVYALWAIIQAVLQIIHLVQLLS